MLYSQNKKRGFTLVELIVVLVILAILAALLIPALTGYIDKSKKSQVIAETRMVNQAVQTVTSELYSGSVQWKTSAGASITLASSSNQPVFASTSLSGSTSLKDRYDEVVKLSDVPSLQDGSGHFFAIVNGNGKVHSIIYSARGYLGVYFSDTQQYAAYKIGEATDDGSVSDAAYSSSFYSTIYYTSAVDSDNASDPNASYLWSCAGIRYNLGLGKWDPPKKE